MNVDIGVDWWLLTLVLGPSPPTSVEEFLRQLGLDHYWESFKEMGFDTLDTLQDLNEAILSGMKVVLSHQGKLCATLKNL